LNLIYHRILFIIKAIDELVQDLVLDNRSNWLVTYGQAGLLIDSLTKVDKTKYLFEHYDSLFCQWIDSIFKTLINKSGFHSKNSLTRKKAEKSFDKIALPSTHKLFLSWYQIKNDEVNEEANFQEWTTIDKWNQWRKKNVVKHIKSSDHGHIIVTIKVRDEVRSRESELTIIDILGFDSTFTDKIMNGETDVELDKVNENDNGKLLTP